MSRLQRILCPTDFSTYSRVALEHALVLARWNRAEIVVLHVTPTVNLGWLVVPAPLPVSPMPPPESQVTIAESLERFAQAAREAEVSVSTLTSIGDPSTEILRAARKVEADLIVIATHGASGFERFLLGSVTEKTLRRSGLPVYVVPSPEDVAVRAEPIVLSTVLCAVDFGPASARALRLGFEVARAALGRLIVLHVLPSLPDDPRALMHVNMPEYVSFLELDARAKLAAWVPADVRSFERYEEIVATGKVYREVLRAAETHAASLIAMGARGGQSLDRRLFGTSASQVVRLAHHPVLVTPPLAETLSWRA